MSGSKLTPAIKKILDSRAFQILFPALALICACLIAIRPTSLWGDEGFTVTAINYAGFGDVIRSLINIDSGSAQSGMPLYVMLEWAWTRIFGESELALRSINAVFAIPYCIVAYKFIKRINVSRLWLLLFLFNPVFLFYLNDARPYSLVLTLGMIFTYAAIYGDLNSYKNMALIHVSFILGISSHMMFVFILILYFVRCLVELKKGTLVIRRQFAALACFLPIYLPLLGYFAYVFLNASETGSYAYMLRCVLQIIYYLLSFGGLGVNRLFLREMEFETIGVLGAVFTGLMAAAYICMLVYFITNKLWKKNDTVFPLAFGCILTYLVFCAVNLIIGTKFWERHIIWLLPSVLLLTVILASDMIKNGQMYMRIAAALIIALSLISGVRTCCDYYYAKDDYKAVASYFDSTPENSLILFQGNREVFEYYGYVNEYTDPDMTIDEFLDGGVLDMTNSSYESLMKVLDQVDCPVYLAFSIRSDYDRHCLYDMFEGDEFLSAYKLVRYQ